MQIMQDEITVTIRKEDIPEFAKKAKGTIKINKYGGFDTTEYLKVCQEFENRALTSEKEI